MNKFILILIGSICISQNSLASVLASCSGNKMPNGVIYSFDFVQLTNSEGIVTSKVEVYSQVDADAPIDFLATERCEGFWKEEQVLVCNTIYDSQYRIDPVSKTATEWFEGESSLYDTCTFPGTDVQ